MIGSFAGRTGKREKNRVFTLTEPMAACQTALAEGQKKAGPQGYGAGVKISVDGLFFRYDTVGNCLHP